MESADGHQTDAQSVAPPEPAHNGDLRAHVALLFDEPGIVVELRALGVEGVRGSGVVSGYFIEPEKLIAAARELDGRARGIYVTLHPVQPEHLARANNRTISSPERTTGDAEILRRRWILIDVDPVRASGISATDAEKEAAFAVAREVREYLQAQGFPAPITADSGNGAHLIYRIDRPADDGGLLQRVLRALAFRFDSETAQVDQTVYNPARISKLYGTLARKGEDTPERPHRRSRLIEAPEHIAVVPSELLEKVAAQAPPESHSIRLDWSTEAFDVEVYLAQHGVEVVRSGPWQNGKRWVLAACPFNAAHTDRSAYVVQFANGAIAAGCHHNGCVGKGWHALRDAVEPCWRERRGPSVSFGSGGGRGAAESWPEPQPLPTALQPVLPFELELLPAAFRPWIEDIAERIQCPVDYPAVASMVALAAVVGRKVGIRPKQRDDWLVVPNLWGALIGRPGVLKTPAAQEPMKPLVRLEIGAKEDFRNEQRSYEARVTVWNVRIKEHERAIRKCIKKGEDALASTEDVLAERPEPIHRRRYITNDSTVEKLGEVLNENPNGVLTFRDELIGLLKSLDKEGHEAARAFYLEAWNGTGRFTYDRIGRGTIDIEAAIVSVLGGIQPGPLNEYHRAAVNAGKGDDGLIQRFQLAVWPDISPDWTNVDEWPDTEARKRAYEVFERLDQLDPASVGAQSDDDDPASIPYVRFSVNAQVRFDAWRTELERQVRSGDEHPAVESHLAKYRSLIPSLALLTHLADGGAGPVGEEPLQKAIRWGKYLESHVRRIHSVAVNPDLPAARALAAKIRSRALKDGFALRDVYRPCWAGLASRDEADRAVKVLVDLDWLREIQEKTPGAPKTYYRINPRVHGMPQGSTDKTDRSSPSVSSGSADQDPSAETNWGEA